MGWKAAQQDIKFFRSIKRLNPATSKEEWKDGPGNMHLRETAQVLNIPPFKFGVMVIAEADPRKAEYDLIMRILQPAHATTALTELVPLHKVRVATTPRLTDSESPPCAQGTTFNPTVITVGDIVWPAPLEMHVTVIPDLDAADIVDTYAQTPLPILLTGRVKAFFLTGEDRSLFKGVVTRRFPGGLWAKLQLPEMKKCGNLWIKPSFSRQQLTKYLEGFGVNVNASLCPLHK